MNTKKLLGYAAVDSGQLLITDPCYLEDEWGRNNEWEGKIKPNEDAFSKENLGCQKDYNYQGCCLTTLHNKELGGELEFKNGVASAGVVFSSGGDGKYPVYAEYKNGKITKITIELT